jgi:hypothetical protein
MAAELTRRILAGGRRAACAGVLLPAVALAACGSSSSLGPGIDPATLTPVSAQLYAGAEVRPSEPLRASARSVAQALTHEPDPYVRLLEALQTPGSPKLDYARDVRPWLGPRAGVFVSSLQGGGGASAGALMTLLQRSLSGEASSGATFPFSSAGAQGAVLLDTSDAGKARSFLSAQAARAGAHASSYRGTAYSVTAGGVAFALVKQLAVIGSEPALHAVIDTSLGAPALARAQGYAKLAAVLPKQALAHVYVNASPAPGATSPTRVPGRSEGNAAALLSALVGGRPLDASLTPTKTTLAVDVDTLAQSSEGGGGGLLAASAAGAAALGELPAESWLGIGLDGAGSALGSDVRGLRGVLSLLAAGGGGSENGPLSVKGLIAGFLAPLQALGAETPAARHDFQEWMRSAALFASGSGLLSIKGGVVILSSAPARSREAVGKLAAALRRAGVQVGPAAIAGTDAAAAVRLPTLPLPLDIANGRDVSGKTKFVIGLGEGSVTAALGATSTLAGGPALRAAASALGEGIQPSATIDFPTLIGLLEAAGLTQDPAVAPLVGYARSLTTLAAGGSHPASGVERLRVTVGLRNSEPGP